MLSGRGEALAEAPTRLEYTYAPWDVETEMLGPSELTFFVSSATSADVDIIVRTYDVARDGTETEVTVGDARVTGLGPGGVGSVSFRDYGGDWVFRACNSLRIKVSNIDFPAFRPPGSNDNLPPRSRYILERAFPRRWFCQCECSERSLAGYVFLQH